MFKNIKLGVRIVLGFVALMIIFVVSGALTYQLADRIEKDVTEASSINLVIAKKSQDIKLDILGVWQWLTDISATQGLDGLDDGFAEAEKSKKSFEQNILGLKAILNFVNDHEKVAQLTELEKKFNAFYEVGRNMAKAYVEGGPALGNQSMSQFDAVAEAISESMDEFVLEQEQQLNVAMSGIIVAVSELRSIVFYSGIFFLVAGLLIIAGITRSVTQLLKRPIKKVLNEVTQISRQVVSASSQVSTTSQSLAEGATEQAASLQETSTTLDQMSNMTRQNADNAEQANNLATEALDYSTKGSEAMVRMIAAINEIKDSSNQTAKIIKSIDEIAFQTNLLALNAAVEAARAGEAGKGFAVVAEEVRNLAKRSADAARTTSDMIEDSQKKSDVGVDVASEVEMILKEVNSAIQKMGTLIKEVSVASKDQAQGVQQFNTTLGEMERVTQNNAAFAEETASASQNISNQTRYLNQNMIELEKIVGGGESNGADSISAGSMESQAEGVALTPERIEERPPQPALEGGGNFPANLREKITMEQEDQGHTKDFEDSDFRDM